MTCLEDVDFEKLKEHLKTILQNGEVSKSYAFIYNIINNFINIFRDEEYEGDTKGIISLLLELDILFEFICWDGKIVYGYCGD